MLLGFQDRFVPYVEEGSKTHTIRAGIRWRVGMRADLFARPRQKGMRLLFRAPVVRVEPIEIRHIDTPGFGGCPDKRVGVMISGHLLDIEETNDFFYRDGFRDPAFVPQNREQSFYPSTNQAFLFWRDRLPFTGQIIHWDFDERFVDIADTCYHLTRAAAQRWAVPT